jgi:hypothetical protein
MAVSLFQKILNRMFQQFVHRTGREPMNPSEWLSIQNSAVNYLNKTKGVAPGPKKPPFEGPGQLRVIQGGKGIESLLESGAVKKGVAPKTKLSTLEGKKQKLDAAINKEEWIARQKQKNKEAIERFKAKTQKKTVEDFRDEGDWDPGGFAGGGIIKALKKLLKKKKSEPKDFIWGVGGKKIDLAPLRKKHGLDKEALKKAEEAHKLRLQEILAKHSTKHAEGGRIAMAGGGALKKFIEQLFIKASNDIRQGKGKWKGLDPKQRMVQHDNLTKKVIEFQKTGELPKGTEQYFGLNPHDEFAKINDAFAKIKAKEDDVLKNLTHDFKGKPYKGLDDEQIMQKAYDEIKGGSGFTDDYKYDADILAEEYARQHGKVYADLPEDQISIYYNPALKRVSQDMLKRREARKALKDVEQKIELQMFDPKDRLPNASGGLAYMLGEPNTRTEALQEFGVVTDPWGMYTDPSLYAQGERSSGVPGRAEYKEGGVGHGPWTMNQGTRTPEQPEQNLDTPQPQVMGTPDPLKMPQGIPSAAPKSMDPRYMQQQMMRQAMMGQQRPRMGQQPRMGYAGGGMSRRAFMKMMSGLAALPLIGKGVQKTAPKVIPKVTETVIERGADGIPTYAFDLIEVVKAKGTKEIIEGLAKRNPPATKYNYKGVEVVEDGLGNTSVKKEQTKTGSWTDEATDDTLIDDYVDREVGFEIKKGEIVKGKKGQPIKTGDEYNESTAYMQGDPDGGMDVSDVVEVIEESDHLDLKKIADEVKDLPIRTKKAGGGPVDTQQLIQMYMEEGLSYEEAVQAAQAASNLDMNLLKRASGGLAHMLGE